jgi:hypothetical protein
MVSVVVPVLVMVTLRVLLVPVGTPVNDSEVGVAPSPGLEPVPVRLTVAVPWLVAKFRVPVAAPAAVGVKLVGTDRRWPALRGSGNWGGEVPKGADVVIPDRVTGRLAVMVTVALAVLPTPTSPKSVVGAWSTGVVGAPNPTTWPSPVPTKTRPPSVAGTENLAAVPIGAW